MIFHYEMTKAKAKKPHIVGIASEFVVCFNAGDEIDKKSGLEEWFFVPLGFTIPKTAVRPIGLIMVWPIPEVVNEKGIEAMASPLVYNYGEECKVLVRLSKDTSFLRRGEPVCFLTMHPCASFVLQQVSTPQSEEVKVTNEKE